MCSPVGDEGSSARVGFDQALFTQRLHRFADSSAAHTQTLREVALGGKLVAGFQRAVQNGLLDLLDDLLVQARSPDDFIHRNFSRGIRFWGTRDGLATIPQLHSLWSAFCGFA